MRVIIACDFELWLNQAEAQTNTGRVLLDKYKTLLVAQMLSCKLVNEFLQEATQYLFDSGVHQVYENVEDYIRENKIGWRLACTIGHIEAGPNHLLEQYALRRLKELVDLTEDQIVLKIQQGFLKDIQYAPGVRDLMSACNIDNPSVEYQSHFSVEVPHCCCESIDGSTYYFCEGHLWKQTNKDIEVSNDWNKLSESFKMVTQLLNSPMCTRQGDAFHVSYGGKTYIVAENIQVVDNGIKTYTPDQLRESSRIAQMARPNREAEYVLESIAKLCECQTIYEMDHIKTYTTNTHKFTILEGSKLLYADQSSVVEKPAHEILEGIYKATGINLQESYKSYQANSIKESHIDDLIELEKVQEAQEKAEIVNRIKSLTEKFAGDPVKLKVLEKLSRSVHAL